MRKGMEGSVEKKSPCNCNNVTKLNRREIKIPGLDMDDIKKQSNMLMSVAVTPTTQAALKKCPSERRNCLCSPTTHAGSFRCRHHRSGMRHTTSVGSNLSEIGSKHSLQFQSQ